MNRFCFMIIVMSMGVTCGFSWGFGSADRCADAMKIVPKLSGLTAEKRTIEEERIIKKCPDGPPGHFVMGLRLERQGKTSEAIDEYRTAVGEDEGFAVAHGNLGLLLLKTGARDEAGVELARGLTGTDDPRCHRGLAELLLDGKMYSLALFHYRQSLGAFPDDASIHLGMAQSYFHMGRLDESEEEFGNALGLKPDDKTAMLGLAAVYKKEKRPDDEINELKKVVTASPGDTYVHKELAEAYRASGEPALAEKEFQLAGINMVDAPEDYIRQGDEYLLSRDYGKAVEKYEEALKKRPRWQRALEKLGDAQMAAGNDEEAIAAYMNVLRIDAANSGIHYSLGVLYERRGQLDKAMAEYGESLAHDPDNGDARRRLADIYTLRGRYPQAIEEYRKIIALRNDNPILQFKLAKVCDKNKDYPGAINAYKEAIKLDAGNVEAHRELAMLYSRRGMAADSEREFREVLRLKNDDIDARNALTALYVNQRQYDDLFNLMKEGVELKPNDPFSHYRLGIMYDFRKDYDNAIAQYEEAISIKSDYAKALNALGKTYLKTGNLVKAREALEAAKKADPNLTEATALLSNLKEERAADRAIHQKKRHHKTSHRIKKSKKRKKVTRTKSRKRKH